MRGQGATPPAGCQWLRRMDDALFPAILSGERRRPAMTAQPRAPAAERACPVPPGGSAGAPVFRMIVLAGIAIVICTPGPRTALAVHGQPFFGIAIFPTEPSRCVCAASRPSRRRRRRLQKHSLETPEAGGASVGIPGSETGHGRQPGVEKSLFRGIRHRRTCGNGRFCREVMKKPPIPADSTPNL